MKAPQPHLEALFRDRPMAEIDALSLPVNGEQLWAASRTEGSPRRRFLDGAIHTAVVVCGLITLTICTERLCALSSTPAATNLARVGETIHGAGPSAAQVIPATAQPINCSFDASKTVDALKPSPKLL